MISPELWLLSSSFAEASEEMIDDGSFAHVACALIPLQISLIHCLQRDVITNYLLEIESEWPWAKQPSRK